MSEREELLREFGVATVQEAIGPSGLIAGPWRQSFGAVGRAIVGPVVTGLNAPGDNLAMHRALETCGVGDVLLLTGPASSSAALWGEMTSLIAIHKQLAGVVVDGALRDLARINRLELPVWFRTTNARTATKHHWEGVNVPVAVGGVPVTPGSYVLADDDGVLVFSPTHLELVIDGCNAIETHENELRRQIELGHTVYELADWGQPGRTDQDSVA